MQLISAFALLWSCTGASDPAPEAPTFVPPHESGLDLVLLGTGTPVPDPGRQGPAVALVYEGVPLLFDAGPGVVRQAAAAADRHRQPALEPGRLRHVFLTHLHSDHTTGLPDVLLGGWVLGRATPLRVVGPPGTKAMVDHLLAAWSADIEIRQGVEGLPERGVAVKVTEVDADGVVYDDEGLTVRAFGVPHGTWPHALGYRIDAGGRSVVISGDTAYSEAVAEACSGCDVLVHEVYSKEAFDAAGSKSFHAYHGTFHTSGPDVGRVATLAEAKQVVLYHQLFFGDSEQGLVEEVQSTYDGPVLSGRDLQRL